MKREFLQSAQWLHLQEATGKEIVPCEEDGFVANGIVHTLPLAGKYLYTPRWPGSEISNFQFLISKLIEESQKRKCRWIRIEPETGEMLEEIKNSIETLRQPARNAARIAAGGAQGGNLRITKAPHDMQPREIFKIDITISEEELLAQMKSKTRYNIRLAEKRGVRVFETRETNHVATFLDLITATSGRKGITPHPRSYYERFFQVLPESMCRLFVAEYQRKVIAANIVMFFGETVTYLHGGTADEHRDVMAPYLLQWEQIKTAKKEGFQLYDFGGVKVINNQQSTVDTDWGGITRFKTGFSPNTAPTVFPGSYDIVLDTLGYFLYTSLRPLQAIKKSIIG